MVFHHCTVTAYSSWQGGTAIIMNHYIDFMAPEVDYNRKNSKECLFILVFHVWLLVYVFSPCVEENPSLGSLMFRNVIWISSSNFRVDWLPLIQHLSGIIPFLVASNMSRRLHATPMRASKGRGHYGKGGSMDSYKRRFNNFVLTHIRNLLDDWEEELALHHFSSHRARAHHKNYIKVRNKLAQVIMKAHNSETENNSPSLYFVALDGSSSPSPSPSLVSKPLDTQDEQATK